MLKIKKKDTKHFVNFALAQGAVILSGYMLKKAFDFGYRKIAKEEPPKTIRSSNHPVGYIVGWALLTGAVAGIGRLFVRDVIKFDVDPHYLEN